jgi:hypothetical protein
MKSISKIKINSWEFRKHRKSILILTMNFKPKTKFEEKVPNLLKIAEIFIFLKIQR